MLPKVIFFTGNLHSGGLERFVTRISVEAVKKQLFQPVVVCLSRKEGIFLAELEKFSIRVLQAPAGWQRNPIALLRFRKQIRELKPTVIHSQVNFSLFQQWLVSLGTCVRFLVTERNMYPLTGMSKLKRILQFYWLLLAGARYSANSEEVAKHLSNLTGYPVSKIPVIPNGIELPELQLEKRDSLRALLGYKSDDFVVGYVARFAAHKGHFFFIQVMRHLFYMLGPQLKLCFVGDGPIRSEVEHGIKRHGMEKLCFFAGVVPNVEDYYLVLDCLALFSDREGMPNAVLEGMAFALPVVANPVGNVKELLGDGCGIVNETNDPEELAHQFMMLVNNPELRKETGLRARNKIERNFSLSGILERLCFHYGIEYTRNIR